MKFTIELKKLPTQIVWLLISLILLYVAGNIAFSLLLSSIAGVHIPSMEEYGVPGLELSGWIVVTMILIAAGIVVRGVIHNDSYKGSILAANTLGGTAFAIGLFVLILALIFGSQTPEIIGGVRDRLRNSVAPVFDAHYVPTYNGGTLRLSPGERVSANFKGKVRIPNEVGYCINADPPVFEMTWDAKVANIWIVPKNGGTVLSTVSMLPEGHPSC